MRAGEPPFYETRYDYDNPDGLLTRITRQDGSTIVKEFEIARRPDAIADRAWQPAHDPPHPGCIRRGPTELVRTYDYLLGFGCTCGQAFVTRETDRAAESPRPSTTIGATQFGSSTATAVKRSCPTTPLVTSSRSRKRGRRDTFEYSERHGQLSAETLDADGLGQRPPMNTTTLGRLTLLRDPAGHEHRHDGTPGT